MQKRPDLNELAKEVFEINKAKGLHENEESNDHFLMLVITELSEAVEADRVNQRARIERFYKKINGSRSYKGLDPEITKERSYEIIYNSTIKGSVEEELSDSVIRLLDLAGLRSFKNMAYHLTAPTVTGKKTFTENIMAICKDIIHYKYSEAERIIFAILNIEKLCQLLSIDLWLHVGLKLEYNKYYKSNKNY